VGRERRKRETCERLRGTHCLPHIATARAQGINGNGIGLGAAESHRGRFKVQLRTCRVLFLVLGCGKEVCV
jgi:hypothetical protein